ncbi:ubiquitin carboxyl-terminal hydrolase 8-like isoform X1 [Anguilla anguilla]|uniref:ubiquitin carboxyl-terminal hydrolase 8-like isoform X1 n=1 Tax=Anguilla anguilla TaxID=7936 RepID=UPI0015AB2D7F|nr:ubiquitin carboxyl-terminal hydrolase 8-like isoform X1 [Anguilla anguilla]XP_035252167.1 ubiquitin carboxyl-terminal hydrolase 8-like isoform X1 [Anguilla anguilla]XP_035252168.1 ubiquitin carboxyl-terminal hydrolase 8-like isoform X1 [Anguilla anguilla]XP_035252169.1 ubiquitin carboxyl-terminal hydrolase 8-like isoform X1 [Anguilla anguilla]
MPAVTAGLKELYLSTSLGDLNKKAEIKPDKINTRSYVQSACKILKAAEESRLDGDEEKAYVLYMKYLTIYDIIKKRPDFKQQQDFFLSVLGPTSLKKAIEQAEKLSDSLKLRYEEAEVRKKLDERERQEERRRKEKSQREAGRGPLKETTCAKKGDNKVKGEAKGLKNETPKAAVPPGGVTPEALFRIMREPSVSLVVMDARSRRDFEESQILVPSQSCISVPAEIISPGITVNQIEAQLPEESKEQWKRRGLADYIVLLDWFSSVKDLRLGSCLQSLKDALYKWDSETTLRAEPLVLEGGYESWLLYYPMYTSNAKAKPPREQTNHPLPTLDFSYPSLEEPGPECPALPGAEPGSEPQRPAEVNGSAAEGERSRSDSAGPREQPKASAVPQTPSSAPTDTSVKAAAGQHAGTAKPVPQINRSRKPAVVVPEGARPSSETASSGREGKCTLNGPAPPDCPGKLPPRPSALAEGQTPVPMERVKRDKKRAQEEERKREGKEVKEAQKRRDEDEEKRNEEKMEGEEEKEQEKRRLERQQAVQEELEAGERRGTRDRGVHAQVNNACLASVPRSIVSDMKREPLTRARSEEMGRTVPGLPEGWMKFLDTVTGTYRYYHSPTNRVHLYPPEVSVSHTPPATPPTLKQKQAQPSEVDRELSKLKRSYSSPDITRDVRHEGPKKPSATPAVNRGTKPHSVTAYTKAEIARPSAAKIRNLNPVFGGLGSSLTGLRNLGNTCYMNSVLQCLCNTPVMTEYFNRNLYLEDINRANILGHKGDVAEEFGVIMKALWSGLYKCISPRDFKVTIGKINEQFAGYEQQDSQELLLFLMDGLHEDLNKRADNRKRYKEEANDHLDDQSAADLAWEKHKLLNESIVVALFQGQFKSTVQCLTCHRKSRTFETFMYLSLPLASTNRCSLQDCLKLFSKEEKLTDNNRVFCRHCKALRDSAKKLEIWKVPPILLVHLKRFSYEGRWKQKLQTSVDFPLDNLDLGQYVIGPKHSLKRYHLYAVSNHYGGLDGGHYTAYCRNAAKQRWFKFDDHEVTDIPAASVKSSAAYIFFYSSL